MPRPKSPVLFWLFSVSAVVLINFLSVGAIFWLPSARFLGTFAGIMQFGLIGELLFIAVISGLAGRTWLNGIVHGTFLSMLWIAAGILAAGNRLVPEIEFVWYAFTLPLLVLSFGSPFLLARLFLGSKLRIQQDAFTPQTTFGVSDIFVVMTVLASVLCLSSVPQVALELVENYFSLGLVMFVAIWILVGVILGFPMVYLVFRIQSRFRRWFALAVFESFLMAIVTIFSVLTSTPIFWGVYASVFAITLPSWIGLSTLRKRGYQLLRSTPRNAPQVVDSHDEELVDRTIAADRRHAQKLAFAIFAVTAVVSLGLLGRNTLKHQKELANDQLHRTMQATGGSINLDGPNVTELQFGPKTTDADLAAFQVIPTVQSISLSNTQITDDGLRHLTKFHGLQSLDLNHTDISDKGLVSLQKLRSLSQLKLGYTSVSVSSAVFLARHFHCPSLDLSGLNMTDDDVNLLGDKRFLNNLELRDNQLTDKGIKEILASSNLESLDLSGNNFDGSCLAGNSSSIQTLTLEHVPLTDAIFASIDKNAGFQRVVLCNTQMTNVALRGIVNCNQLEFGDGAIDDQGLALSGITSLTFLKLKSKQFTGKCFETWSPYIRSLDLSDSGIQDETIPFLSKIAGLSYLWLNDTNITDTALPHLVKLPIQHLDLSNTQVTYEALIKTPFAIYQTVKVAVGQFTPAQVRELKRKIPLVVGSPRK